MENWLASIGLLVVAILSVSVISRHITRATGRTKSMSGMSSMLAAACTACVVMVEAEVFHLPLPWLVLAAGVSAGALGLLAQVLVGRRAN